MDRNYFVTLFTKVQEPERIIIQFVDNKYAYIESAKDKNDTVDWFCINGSIIEDSLKEHNLSWCYLIETEPYEKPYIYMFIGDGLKKEFVLKEVRDIKEKYQENIFICKENLPFSSINIDNFDNSISELEKELMNKSTDVLRVYTP